MFQQIGSVKNIPNFLQKCKSDKNTLLYGFGHRVFKAYDPRALIIKNMLLDFHK